MGWARRNSRRGVSDPLCSEPHSTDGSGSVQSVARGIEKVVRHRGRFSPLLITILSIVVALAVMLNLFSARWAKDRVKEARQAIQDVLDAQVAAWNQGDLDGFMTGYWHSPDLTFFSAAKVTS